MALRETVTLPSGEPLVILLEGAGVGVDPSLPGLSIFVESNGKVETRHPTQEEWRAVRLRVLGAIDRMYQTHE